MCEGTLLVAAAVVTEVALEVMVKSESAPPAPRLLYMRASAHPHSARSRLANQRWPRPPTRDA